MSAVMAITMVAPAYAAGYAESSTEVDANVAATLAALFVGSNLENENSWTMETGISGIEPLYDADDNINAYCVKFFTGEKDAGYVVISTDVDKQLIQEYAVNCEPIFEMPEFISNIQTTTASTNTDNRCEKIYYAGTMRYSANPEIFEITNLSSAVVDITSDTERQELREDNVELISWILETGTLNDRLPENPKQARLPVERIKEPLTYLKKAYPSWVFSNAGYYNMGENAVPGYIQLGTNTCAMYSTAAILKYYLGNKYTFTQIKNEVLNQMEKKFYYRGNGDYYLPTGQYEDFLNTCLNHYGFAQTAWSSLLTWERGTDYISKNRPIMLNISYAPGGDYSNHTVTAYAWTQFKANNGTSVLYRFFKVRDGASIDGRYVYMDGQGPSYITSPIR